MIRRTDRQICDCVCFLVCPLLSLQVGLPSTQGDAVAVAAPHWHNTVGAAWVSFIPVSQPTQSSQ